MEKTTHQPGLLQFDHTTGQLITVPVKTRTGDIIPATPQNSEEKERALKDADDFKKNFAFTLEDGIPRVTGVHFAAD